MDITILGIESSSCDDTSAAVIRRHAAAVERHCQSGSSPAVRRRNPRAGLARAPAEYHSGSRPGGPRGGHRHVRPGRYRLHARSRPARLVARGRLVCQGAGPVARRADDGDQPPAGAYLLALHRPARPRPAASRGSRSCACSCRAGHSQIVLVKDYARHGDRRHDDRRRGRRSIRQVRQDHGPSLPRRPGDRPTGQGRRPASGSSSPNRRSTDSTTASAG